MGSTARCWPPTVSVMSFFDVGSEPSSRRSDLIHPRQQVRRRIEARGVRFDASSGSVRQVLDRNLRFRNDRTRRVGDGTQNRPTNYLCTRFRCSSQTHQQANQQKSSFTNSSRDRDKSIHPNTPLLSGLGTLERSQGRVVGRLRWNELRVNVDPDARYKFSSARLSATHDWAVKRISQLV